MASSIRVKSLFAILVFLFEMKRNVLCAHDEDVTLCLSEFNQDKECNVRAEFGKEIQVYCPIDAEQTRNGGVVRMNGHEVNNDNTCFSKMKSNDTSNRNVIKKFEDYVQNLIMHTNDSDSTHYLYVPHTMTTALFLSCNCIDKSKQKAYKLNIQIAKNEKKNIKGCNFYYSEEEGQQKENSIEKNINVKYKKVCSVDVHANDVVSFRCRIHNRYSSVFVNPPLCFHDVSNENNEILQISGLLNEAKVIPRLTTYVHDPMMAKFLSYLVSPPHVNESLRVECTCTITDNVLDTSYVGTISLNFIKTDKLHPVQEEEDAEYRNRWKYSIDENEMENGENINNSSPRDGKKNARSSSVLTGLSVVLLLFLFLP
ncbi:Pf52-like protein, putative [Plasmodium knowlesi strain H]|uniref:Pf52-like protein, putative n=3 Tax=Plasmodium knowlesi TaxID=5850 RepID=A0A5K1VT29_PLAKH|nr:6-cysteine protein, putative [Plasmodium knowlesi strain H]OTN68591.1 putative Pf52-like protein [Plasmodium knowlesi]CAA9986454.1 6-cysteine protein, putative [Plasmodium knowlesi strain H]SBO24296.1 Pf52-like protein, putative [Plasmodium knowlesi strain H]SBO29702.1 Pf52-like protein, putative [Plasmodium knowlesi strain H]VVS75928.1 6-cysteine protein, putative [Plasmodium knowlesi strain H]|eukprot:XP_002261005.1 Pf52-like protein, putative [Plasmodium knowlesi strain H]